MSFASELAQRRRGPLSGLDIRLESWSPSGLKTGDTGWIASDSLLHQWLEILRVQMTQLYNVTSTDTGSTVRTVIPHAINLDVNAAVTDDSYGPVVGTGTGGVILSDTALQTKIAEGSGAGQLSHAATSVSAPTTSGDEARIDVTRVFTNNHTSNLTIQEVGLFCQARELAATNHVFCIAREIASATVAANGGTTTLTCRIFTAGLGCINFMKLLQVQFGQANVAGVVDIDGTTRTVQTHALNLFIDQDGQTYSLFVGTGTGAFDPTDTALGALVADGTSSGQLDYQEADYRPLVRMGRDTNQGAQWSIDRDIHGNGTDDVVVGELGAQMRGQDSGGTARTFLGFRHALRATRTIYRNSENSNVSWMFII